MASPCFAEWAITYNNTLHSQSLKAMQKTTDGGYVVVGDALVNEPVSHTKMWVLKLKADGDVDWSKVYGGDENYTEHGYSIQQTADQGYIVAGYSQTFGNHPWIVKLYPNGNIEWQRTYNWSFSHDIYSVKQTKDGGYIMLGAIAISMSASSDFWVVKLNSDGTINWQKAYGGGGYEFFRSIEQTEDEGYVVAGATESFGAGGRDLWVIKLNPDGSIAWQKTYGGLTDDGNYAKIKQTADGGYIIGANTASFSAGDWDIWILKLYANGGIEWEKSYGGTYPDEIGDMQQTSDGGYVVSGYTRSFGFGLEDGTHQEDIWVFKLNPDGSIAWEKTYGGNGSEVSSSIQQISNGQYIIGGYTTSKPYVPTGADAWILNLNNEGEIPGCVAMKNSQATVSQSEAIVAVTNVVPTDTLASFAVTDVAPTIVSIEQSTTCFEQYELTATMVGSGSGILTATGLSCNGKTCTGTYLDTTSVTIVPSPDSESTFLGWSGCDSTVGNTCIVTMNEDKNVTATFSLVYLTLTVNHGGTGDGKVISTPSGINCEPDCSEDYIVGTQVSLNAQPNQGSAFAYWSGGCSGASDTCSLTMTDDNTVIAHFVLTESKQYKLKTKKARKNKGDGIITSNDGNINCGETCSYNYFGGTTVTLSAEANQGSTFIGWKSTTLNCIGTDPCTVKVDKAKTVQAVFVGDYGLRVVNQSKKGGTGTVTSSPTGINCITGNTTGCEALYGHGETVTLAALAEIGSVFVGWAPAKLCPGIGDCVVPIDKKRTIKAVFSGP